MEGITFLTMMKWAAVRGNELPKIRDVQVHAIDNLLNKDSVVL